MVFPKRSERRKVIVHFHLFKNAGSTIDYIFRKNFPNGCCGLEGPTASSVVSTETGIQFILNNPKLRVLTSHQLLYPLPEYEGLLIYTIFFLRHPIDRIGSIYRYQRKQESSDLHVLTAKQTDFKHYILWLLEVKAGRAGGIRNYQVRRLSGGYSTDLKPKPLIEDDLNIAKNELEKSEFFGIVERFDDSLLYMKNYLRNDFPKNDYSYVVQNQSATIASIEERLSDIKAQLGPELYQRLLEINYLDLELYHYALKLFDDRMKITR